MWEVFTIEENGVEISRNGGIEDTKADAEREAWREMAIFGNERSE
jgi:hypothetical protein